MQITEQYMNKVRFQILVAWLIDYKHKNLEGSRLQYVNLFATVALI
jgi:hypothetical protein